MKRVQYQPILFTLLVTLIILTQCKKQQDISYDQTEFGILQSNDQGLTWSYQGLLGIQDLSDINPADPTPIILDEKIAIYYIDLMHLEQPVAQNIYLSTSSDGLNFNSPLVVYSQSNTMMDPFTLCMSKNLFRLYVSSGPDGLISLSSIDGKSFSFEGTIIQGGGGMVGAILLPDNRVRLFLEGGTPPNNPGLISMISIDGRHFVAEDGYRILKPAEYFNINNPQPIKLANGDYFMLYQLSKQDNPDAEIHLATSKNGYDWIIDPRIIGYGGTCCLIQATNGTLFIYNANLTPKI